MGKDKKVKKGKQEADFGEEEEVDLGSTAKAAAGPKKGKKGKSPDDLENEDNPNEKKNIQVIKDPEDGISNKTKKGKKKGKHASDDEDEEASAEVKNSKKKGKERKSKRHNEMSDEDELVDTEDSKLLKKGKDDAATSDDDAPLIKGKKKKVKGKKVMDESDGSEDDLMSKKKGKVKDDVAASDDDAPKTEMRGKKKKGKGKKVVEESDNSELELTSKKKSKGKKEEEEMVPSNRKPKSGFQMLEVEGMDIDDRDDDDEEEEEEEEVVPIVEVKKEQEKKGKKSKKDRKKKDEEDEEDLDKILAELALEIDGSKSTGAKEEPKGPVSSEIPVPDAKGKKKKSKKESTPEESVEVKKEGSEVLTTPIVAENEGDEEGAGVKTAAQKKKEKKERERQKKLQQNQFDKAKKQAKEEQTAIVPEVTPDKELTPVPMDVEELADDKDDADDDDKSKKKKKKGKKGAVAEDEKADKKKPGKKALAAMQETLKKLKEDEERRQQEEEAKEKAAEEAEDRRLEKIRLEEERKERKKQKEKEKKERLKAEGKLLSKAQKQARARAEATLQVLRQQGVILPPVGGGAEGVRAPRLGDRRRGPQKKKQEETPSSPLSPTTEFIPKVEVEVVGPKEPSAVTPNSPTGEPEKEVKESWEEEKVDVKEAWDESSNSEDNAETEVTSKKATPLAASPAAKKATTNEAPPPAKTIAAKPLTKVDNKKPPKIEKSDGEDDEESEEDSSSEQDEDEDESEDSSEDDSESEDSEESEEEATVKRYQAKTRQTIVERIAKRKEDAEKKRTTDKLRSPVVCVLGHVDTGKTKILDKIRNTHVQDGEAGGITQQIGATMVPQFALKEQCKMVKNFLNLDLKLPGLLIIDTPGHESFSNLRSRGSSLCDIAVLVVDIMHGLEPQTIESLNMLKQRKTPFIVALNKIDRLYEWKPNRNKDVQDVIRGQQRNTKMEFDERTKEVVLQFNEQGMNVALFYDNPDARTYVSLVPTSAASGDGMGNLMALVVELSQNVMAKRLAFSEELQATVLEVKAIPGLGTTIDVILVNGCLHEGDTIVVAGHDGPVVTQIRSLLMPQPLKELRVKNPYQEFKEVEGAQGVKIAGKDLDKAIAGLQLLVAHHTDEVDVLKAELSRNLKEVMNAIKLSERGVYVQASTLGSLEALLEFLRTSKIPYSGIRIGPVVKKDVMKASIMLEHDNQYAVILAFDVKVERDAQDLADTLGVRIFQADIIYHLFDKFTGHREELRQKRRDEFKHVAVFPCRLRILPQFIFNSRDPIVLGVSVESGVLREGTPLCVPTKEFLEIGTVTTIEVNHKTQDSARKGQEVCIKIESMGGDAPKMFGRHFDQTDLLVSKITRASIDACKEHFRDDLQKTDWQLMVELKKLFQIL